jgi:hypothetical protein
MKRTKNQSRIPGKPGGKRYKKRATLTEWLLCITLVEFKRTLYFLLFPLSTLHAIITISFSPTTE